MEILEALPFPFLLGLNHHVSRTLKKLRTVTEATGRKPDGSPSRRGFLGCVVTISALVCNGDLGHDGLRASKWQALGCGVHWGLSPNSQALFTGLLPDIPTFSLALRKKQPG
jgi:hypothetical protein